MILLDTHVLLWLMAAPARISANHRRAIEDAVAVFFSPVSVAEIRIKQMLGRLEAPTELERSFQTAGLQELPLTAAQAERLTDLPDLVHHDPFDRLLLAQAAAERCRFSTADRLLLGLGLPWVLDARGEGAL